MGSLLSQLLGLNRPSENTSFKFTGRMPQAATFTKRPSLITFITCHLIREQNLRSTVNYRYFHKQLWVQKGLLSSQNPIQAVMQAIVYPSSLTFFFSPISSQVKGSHKLGGIKENQISLFWVTFLKHRCL